MPYIGIVDNDGNIHTTDLYQTAADAEHAARRLADDEGCEIDGYLCRLHVRETHLNIPEFWSSRNEG